MLYYYVVSDIDEVYVVRVYRCPKSGVAVSERWENHHFQKHRVGGPACIKRDRETGTITHIEYRENNLGHREGGKPSSQEFDRDGNLLWRAFSVHGEYERENDLPHYEEFDPRTGHRTRAEYRIKNPRYNGFGKAFLYHRNSGPAVLTFDRTDGKLTGVEFYRRGRKQKLPNDFRLGL